MSLSHSASSYVTEVGRLENLLRELINSSRIISESLRGLQSDLDKEDGQTERCAAATRYNNFIRSLLLTKSDGTAP